MDMLCRTPTTQPSAFAAEPYHHPNLCRLSHYTVELALMDMVQSSPAVRLADQVMQQIKEGRDTLTATYTGEGERHACEGAAG